MIKPKFNSYERWNMRLETSIGNILLFQLAWFKFIRESKRTKLFKSFRIFS